jgi:hypothetical protein
MDKIRQRIEELLPDNNEHDLAHAMFTSYLPAIEAFYSGLHLNFVSPEEDHPILGGRAMEGDLQGIIIAIDKSRFGEDISPDSITEIQNHIEEFISHAQQQKEFTTASDGLGDLYRQFSFKASQGVNLSSQTTILVISQGMLNEDLKSIKDSTLPIEIIDASVAEHHLTKAEDDFKSNEGTFTFNAKRHDLPKVFRDPAPHKSHAIHMGHITGLALSDMFRTFGRKMIEANVRDFLGNTSINKGMRETIKDEPERFAAYNNGLTIVCSSVKIVSNEIIEIENPSVVNGGQTTMVIVDEARKGTEVHKVRVPIRVVEILSENAADKLRFPALISRYANMQNNIKSTDQLVNESPHPELNVYSDEHVDELNGWFYAHRRGMVKTLALEMGDRFETWEKKHPPVKRVEAIDASTMWAAWIGEPAAAALGAQRCFIFYHGYVTTEYAKERLKLNHFLKQTFALQMLKNAVSVIARTTKQTTMFSSTLPHTLGWFSSLTEHKYDLIAVFESGKVDDNTRVVLRTLFDKVNEYLRKIEEELPSEHAKKRECAEIIQAMTLDVKILERIQELPRTLGRPLKGEPLGRFLIRIGASKLWDAFKYIQHEHSDGNMGGMGKDFFNGMKFGFTNKGADMDAGEVIKIMRVWNLANQLGYSDHYPGENDLYLVR